MKEDSVTKILTKADKDQKFNLQSLIIIIDFDNIIEIWKVFQYNYSKCYQYIILLNIYVFISYSSLIIFYVSIFLRYLLNLSKLTFIWH